MCDLDPADNELVYRLAWDPEHKGADGRFSLTFETADLRGKPDKDGSIRCISVDRKGRITPMALEERIARHRANPNVGAKRVTPIFLPLLVDSIRKIMDEGGIYPLSVMSDPVIPGNEGHCAIQNVSGKGKTESSADREYRDFLRSALIDLCGMPISKAELLDV